MLLASTLAPAQTLEIQAPPRVLVAEPFSLDIVLGCPPPGEAPPPAPCAGLLAHFEVSDKTAGYPHNIVLIQANEPIRVGPFTFHRRGPHFIVLTSEEFGWLGMVEFPVESRRRR